MFKVQSYVTSFHDFSHDSAKRANTMALAAPKVQSSGPAFPSDVVRLLRQEG